MRVIDEPGRQAEALTRRLTEKYAGTASDEFVRRLVEEAFDSYRTARITQFLPVLVDRRVRTRLELR